MIGCILDVYKKKYRYRKKKKKREEKKIRNIVPKVFEFLFCFLFAAFCTRGTVGKKQNEKS